MNHATKGIAELSPEEKRALLVKLLESKIRKSSSASLSAQKYQVFLDRFAISVADLQAEAVLDPAIHPETVPVTPITKPAHIFLTGATGFLGAFLLYELLQKTRADIHCLVRCSNMEEGKQRIHTNLESYFPENNYLSSRIIPVVGDLSEPLLGLSAQQFQMLARQIDIVYHNGALVNWIYSYNKLKPTNVLGTQEVLRLACKIQTKPVHFVSTLAVFPLIGSSEVQVIREQDSIDHAGLLHGGYMQSKWVAEKLVTIARSRGLPVCVYRPGLITGDSRTGAWNTDDVTCKMIRSWIELGYVPDLDAATDMTPVDYVSSAIVYLSSLPQSLGQVFHLVNPHPVHMNELVTWIRSLGFPLQRMPYDKWRAELIDMTKLSQENTLSSLAPLFSETAPGKVPKQVGQRAEFDYQDTLDGLGSILAAQYATRSVRFDCQHTIDELAGTSIVCPQVDAKVFEAYLSYFISNGFLEALEA